MTAIMSPTQSPTSSPHQIQSPPNTNSSSLPPLNTGNPNRRTTSQRPQSYAKNRMSSYSTTSKLSETRSRPVSHAFPAFHSSLPYALVRDFAYPILHPWHYGPPPEPSGGPSGNSTPASERQQRLWDPQHAQWGAGSWEDEGFFSDQHLPQMAYGDGPPYSEDEDLHSPVVVSSRQKRSKRSSSKPDSRQTRGGIQGGEHDFEDDDEDGAHRSDQDGQRSYFAGINGEGMETYYIGEEDESANGPGGELVTYAPDQAPHSMLAPNTYGESSQRDSHYATTLPNRSYMQRELTEDSDEDGSGEINPDRDSRYSKDYQFTIASPDEEMHGKAVALFDFVRENENELPLSEGQVIWVSYRHGQGWLVAEDPKTRESGLVPEEYVRLVRHIEGGLTYLSNEQDDTNQPSPVTAATDSTITPTQVDPERTHTPQNSASSNGGAARPPIVSTFSTSSKDLKPYPHHLLEEQTRGTPPQVVHYGSQSDTPIVTSPTKVSQDLQSHEELADEETDVKDNKRGKKEEKSRR